MFTVQGHPKQGWGGWSPVGSGIYTQPGSYITADWDVADFWLNVIDISGVIYTIVGDPQKGWRPYGFTEISGVPGRGSPVTKLGSDLFVTDVSGGIYMKPGVPGLGTFEPVPGGFAAPGTPVAACRTPGGITLFCTNREGVVLQANGTF